MEPPYDPSVLNARAAARYDYDPRQPAPPPPPPLFLRPDFNPHHHHHHHRRHFLPPPQPPPPPPPRHHPHHHRPSDDPRLYHPLPSDRVLLLHGPPRRETSPRDILPRARPDAERFRNAEKFRILEPIPLEFARRSEASNNRGSPYPREEREAGLVGRKRHRWPQDWILEDGSDRRSQRRLEFFDGDGRRPDPRFDRGPPPPPLPDFSPRSSRHGLTDRGREAAVRAPQPIYYSSGRSRADFEAIERNKAVDFSSLGREDDDGYRDSQDDRFLSNKGKRRTVNNDGCLENLQRNSTSRSPWKPRVLNRTQSSVSVWDRIEEKRPPLTPPPPSPPHEYLPPQHGFSEENQPEADRLDLSYKPSGLVAKVLVPQSSAEKSPAEKSPEVKPPSVSAPKKKVVLKKVANKREKVIAHIKPGLSGSGVKCVVKKPVSNSPCKVSNQLEASEKATSSSATPVHDASPQRCPKRVTTMPLTAKIPAKRLLKNIGSVEVGTNEVRKAEDNKISMTKKRTKKCVSTKTPSKNHSGSQLCQQGSIMVETSTEKGGSEISNGAVDPVEHGGIEDLEEGECLALNANAGQNCASSLISDIGFVNDSRLHNSVQEVTGFGASLENETPEGPAGTFTSMERLIATSPAEEVRVAVEDAEQPVHADISFPASTRMEPSSGLEDIDQVITPAVSLAPFTENDSLKCVTNEREGDREEKQQQHEVDVVAEEVGTLGNGDTKSNDACLHFQVHDMLALSPMEVKPIVSNVSPPSGSMDGKVACFSVPVDGPSMSDNLQLVEVSPMVSEFDSIVETVEHSLFTSVCQDTVHCMDTEQSLWQLSDGTCRINGDNNNNGGEQQTNIDDCFLVSERSLVTDPEQNMNMDETMIDYQPNSERTSLSHGSKEQITANLEVAVEEATTRKTSVSPGVPRVLPNRASLVGLSRKTNRFGPNSRHRTWQRSNTTSSTSLSHGKLHLQGGTLFHKQSPKTSKLPSSSYIRKGNSLIRKPATEVPLPCLPHGLAVNKNATTSTDGLESKANITDQGNYANSFERPKTPPLPLSTNLPNSNIKPMEDGSDQMLENPIFEAGLEAQVGPPESQIADLVSGSVNNQIISGGRKSEPLNTRRMIYVKRKSNQLVAAPGPEFCDSSAHPMEKAQALSSFTSPDIYYRRKKNQLIRNALSSEVQYKQDVTPVDNSNFDDHRMSAIYSLKHGTTGPFRKRLDKVIQKTSNYSKSLVWTLSGDKSHRKGVTLLNCWNVLPSLFPWKRTVYRKSSSSISNRHSLSLISRKLQLTRKRNTIYTVSNDGFSLRKAGVLSIGGSSLKWSKSIEKRSKKASEEATLAVAEVERKKRERKQSAVLGQSEKNRNRLPRKSAFGIELQQGERIFRVGSARYKMDSSRRTLIRIPDEQSTCAVDQQLENNSQKSFVPKRLLIDNDEYIRVGNGNQLIRDPKKLKRILASEKVRWSLHTVRLRMARKQQYCQFFTRFGKCNKNGGKCPYIHDATKVAICTKFLRGVCSNTDCKLTHKILPERMPDCSYFLQGLCTNTCCPYRHVNVNPKASVCEGFLRGYCAEGDECRKKHSYVCPIFEATGKCPQGSTCKLHHPKGRHRHKTKKRKRSKVQSNSKGRYFGSSINEVGKPVSIASNSADMEKDGDLFCCGGQFTDYIGLDVASDDDIVQTNVAMDLHPAQLDSDVTDLHPDDLDGLIKPVRIMNKASSTRIFL